MTQETVTKQERVYRELRERILNGAYTPGYRVVIDALARELEVSALPVREAVRRLEAEGLVVYRANAGAQVAPADPALFDEQMSVLAVLEGYATALAAPALTADDLEHLEQVNERMRKALEDLDPLAFGKLNGEFHAYVHDRCPNASLVELLHDVAERLDAIRRTVFIQIPYRGAASIEEHADLIELIRKGAAASKVERAAREHKLHTVESFRAWRAEHGS